MDRAKKREKIAKIVGKTLDRLDIPKKAIAEATGVGYDSLRHALTKRRSVEYDWQTLSKNIAKGIRKIARQTAREADKMEERIAKLDD